MKSHFDILNSYAFFMCIRIQKVRIRQLNETDPNPALDVAFIQNTNKNTKKKIKAIEKQNEKEP